VAFGPERTIEQDPTFAFRIIVDIAIKALSAAINDPSTAVLAIDQLQRLPQRAGERQFRDEGVREASDKLRIVLRTPNWEDFVELAVREIRLCGASNFQVARRLRAMLLNLVANLPDCRQPTLELELRLLDKAIESARIACWPAVPTRRGRRGLQLDSKTLALMLDFLLFIIILTGVFADKFFAHAWACLKAPGGIRFDS
jgi:hypothetical protein